MKLRFFWVFCALFIVYATTLPFEFDPAPSQAAAKLMRVLAAGLSDPDGSRPSLPDMFQNVLLFMPFGVLGMLSLVTPRPGRTTALAGGGADRGSGVGALVLVTIAGSLLALSVETLQLFTVDRVSSLNDIVTNTFGTLMGGITVLVLAPLVRELAGRMEVLPPDARESLRAIVVATLLLAVAAWHPFDASLDVGRFVAKVHTFVANPWQSGTIRDEGVDLLRYGFFGGAVALWLHQRGARWPRQTSLLLVMAAAFAFELSQFLIGARMPGLSDALIGVTGGCVGAELVPMMRRMSRRAIVLVVVVAAWLASAVMILSPFTSAPEHTPIGWVPFLTYYRYTSTQTVSHVLELMLAFFPVGYVLAVARVGWPGIAGVAVMLASVLEYLQGWIAGRYPDITDVMVMTLGAVIGAWTAAAFVLRDSAASNRARTAGRPVQRAT